MKKLLGSILAIIGVIGILLSFESVRRAIKLILPASLSNNYLLIIGIILFIFGGLLLFGGKKSGKQGSEVPIYQGNQIVGYRRV